ncbi:MAG: patatin-like phospholipase family protein [Chromatiales bacterium]|nr:patatin-like phospholipase family protein [Chromatiales bacterium]
MIPKYLRILSIDGGGMRGLISAYVLADLEERLQQLSGDPNVGISDYFDLIVGTSTGAIIGSALLLPNKADSKRYTAEQIVKLYKEQGNEIFESSIWQTIKSFKGFIDAKFSDSGIRNVLKQHFKDVELKDLTKPCLFTAYDLIGSGIFFFRQHKATQQAHYNFFVRDMIRACTAAPVLFPVAEIRSTVNRLYYLIDGGVYAYNPALCAYAEIREIFPRIRANNLLMLSVSGGTANELQQDDNEFKDWGAWDWIKVIQHIAFSGQADVADYQLKQMFLTCEERGQYLRVCPSIGKEILDSDDAGEENLMQMHDIATALIEKNKQLMDNFVGLLMKQTAAKQPPWAETTDNN